MNALTRFERLDDVFPEMVRRFMRPTQMNLDAPAEIRVDVSETDKEYQVRAEIPGAKKEDIRISIDRNFVLISAEVKQEKEEKSGNGARSLVKEMYYGGASRGFSLAQEVDEAASVAKYEDGVLKLTLPKRREAASKTLAIQ